MKLNTKTFLLLLTLCILLPAWRVVSQDMQGLAAVRVATDSLRLAEYSVSLRLQYELQYQEAMEMAARNNWVIKGITPEGREFELQRVINGQPVYYITHNLNAAKTLSANKVWNGGGLGLSLNGTGLTLREWDGGKVKSTHTELTGRVTTGDGASTFSAHSTHVAGTLIASGVSSSAKGMSPASNLKSFDWNYDISEMATEAASGMLLSNSSYGFISGWYYDGSSWTWYGDPLISNVEDYKFGFYDDFARQTDSICRLSPYYLPCKSAGNDRGDYNGSGPQEPDGGADGFDCIPDMGTAKNNLTVGCVNDIPDGYHVPADVIISSFSGWGPTDDGRIKPDIVANGIGLYSCSSTNNTSYTVMSGTSMASPNACGSLNLLQQHYYNLNTAYMRAATLKALVIHTADEAGPASGPDYMFGWGLLNIAKAATVISEKNTNSLINEPVLNNGGAYTLNVLATGGEPLRVTIAWTDPRGPVLQPALNPTTAILVNDLDLRIDGTCLPWSLNPASPASGATTGDNTRDNIEQVVVYAPAAGLHTISVTHKGSLSGGSQAFSIIVTGIYSTVADPVPFTATNTGGTKIDLAWTKNVANNNILLAYSTTGAFGTPVNGTAYSAGNTIPGGGIVLYNGSNSTFSHTGLSAGTSYYYRIWSYNGSTNYSFGRNAGAATPCMVYNSFPVTENFNGTTFPTCWSQQPSGNGTTNDWSVSATTNAGGSANEMRSMYQSVDPGLTRLKTSFFSTIGLSQLNLSFKHLLDDFGPGATLRVQSSSDGVTWTNEAWSMATVSNTNKGPYTVNTTIVNNLNSPTTMISFVIEGDLYQYDYWYIDNVSITAPGYWIGGTAGNLTDWGTAANWGDLTVPTAATNVIITPRTNQPVVNADPASPAQCNNLTIWGNATMTINPGKKLVVNGTSSKK